MHVYLRGVKLLEAENTVAVGFCFWVKFIPVEKKQLLDKNPKGFYPYAPITSASGFGVG